jgi:hypothetical protein
MKIAIFIQTCGRWQASTGEFTFQQIDWGVCVKMNFIGQLLGSINSLNLCHF